MPIINYTETSSDSYSYAYFDRDRDPIVHLDKDLPREEDKDLSGEKYHIYLSSSWADSNDPDVFDWPSDYNGASTRRWKSFSWVDSDEFSRPSARRYASFSGADADEWESFYPYWILKQGLDEYPSFSYTLHSVPRTGHIHSLGASKELYSTIQAEMSKASVVLIWAGYLMHSMKIDKELAMELEIARTEFPTPMPIIMADPGNEQYMPSVLRESANRIVDWDISSIVEVIKVLVDNPDPSDSDLDYGIISAV